MLGCFKSLAVAGCVSALAIAGSAQAATCGITGTATATTATYDPFESTNFSTVVTLNLARVNGSGGEKTDIVNFYLKGTSADSNGTTVVAQSAAVAGQVIGLGYDVFYDYNQSNPTVGPTSLDPTAGNKFLKVIFSGNNKESDTVDVTFQVTLPQNVNASAGSYLPFDVYFACSTTGGGGKTQQTGSIAEAIKMPISVPSALRASYAGTALDFGELVQVNDTQAPTVKTATGNYVRVQSSGPYQVQLSSAGNYTMTPNGATTSDPLQKIRYSLKFLGQTLASGSTPVSQVCKRAQIGDLVEDRLLLQGTLVDGGTGKAISPNYRDTLTVTISPLAATTNATVDCGAFTL